MRNLKSYLKANILVVVGLLIGAIGGWMYWYFVGCESGTCMITSKPLNSTAYGSLMGGLLGSIFVPSKKK